MPSRKRKMTWRQRRKKGRQRNLDYKDCIAIVYICIFFNNFFVELICHICYCIAYPTKTSKSIPSNQTAGRLLLKNREIFKQKSVQRLTLQTLMIRICFRSRNKLLKKLGTRCTGPAPSLQVAEPPKLTGCWLEIK